MNKLRLLIAAGVGATVALGVSFAVQAMASGSSSPTTYYACLKAGKLSQVGISAPTCSSKATPIQWNSYPESTDGTPQCTGIPHVGIDLQGCDLAGSTMAYANLAYADLKSTNLSDSYCTKPRLGPQTLLIPLLTVQR